MGFSIASQRTFWLAKYRLIILIMASFRFCVCCLTDTLKWNRAIINAIVYTHRQSMVTPVLFLLWKGLLRHRLPFFTSLTLYWWILSLIILFSVWWYIVFLSSFWRGRCPLRDWASSACSNSVEQLPRWLKQMEGMSEKETEIWKECVNVCVDLSLGPTIPRVF